MKRNGEARKSIQAYPHEVRQDLLHGLQLVLMFQYDRRMFSHQPVLIFVDTASL